MRLEIHLMARRNDEVETVGVVSLRDGQVQFDEPAERFLAADGNFKLINPLKIDERLTPEDGVAYMLALPVNLRGSYCWAEIPGVDLQKTTIDELFECFGIGAEVDERSTAARYRSGPAARLCDTPPDHDQLLGCWQCGWIGTVGQAPAEYFRECWHRECPECEKMLLIMPYERPPIEPDPPGPSE